jgi:hypothetical protein
LAKRIVIRRRRKDGVPEPETGPRRPGESVEEYLVRRVRAALPSGYAAEWTVAFVAWLVSLPRKLWSLWGRKPANPFLLLKLLPHPFVHAELVRTERKRTATTAVLIGLPLLVLGLALVAGLFVGTAWAPAPGTVVWTFVSFWPLVLVLGVAVRVAGSILDERDGDTADQLVLTPMPRTVLAAAKILPQLVPFLLGVLAALPLYIWAAGGRGILTEGGLPRHFTLWPTRMTWGMVSPGDTGLDIPDYWPAVSLQSVGPAGFMALTDAIAVWAFAHWAAAGAIQTPKLTRTIVGLFGKACALYFAGYIVMALSGLTGLLLAAVDVLIPRQSYGLTATLRPALILALVVAVYVVFMIGWCHLLLRLPVRAVLERFAWFDHVAGPEFQPRDPRRPQPGWRFYPPRR